VNKDLVRKSSNDIPIEKLIQALPMYNQGAFKPTYKDYSWVSTRMRGEKALLQEFDKDVYSERLEGDMEPYRYGSYFIHEANNKTK
jgi:hypothetical protein